MAESITFLDDLVDISEVIADAQLYFSDSGKNKTKCKFFDSDGLYGMPEDAYSIADVRMDIQLGSKVGKPVTFKLDCVMEDGSYLSEQGAAGNIAKIQKSWDEFIGLSQRKYLNDIIKTLIDDVNKAFPSVGNDTCKSIIVNTYSALGKPEDLEGLNARSLAKAILEFINKLDDNYTKMLVGCDKQDKERFDKAYYSTAMNIAAAIETNNADALTFFKNYPLTNSDTAVPFATSYQKEFPKITRDSYMPKPKKEKPLAKNIDEPEELLKALERHMNDRRYREKFKQTLRNMAEQTSDEDTRRFYKAIITAIDSNK